MQKKQTPAEIIQSSTTILAQSNDIIYTPPAFQKRKCLLSNNFANHINYLKERITSGGRPRKDKSSKTPGTTSTISLTDQSSRNARKERRQILYAKREVVNSSTPSG